MSLSELAEGRKVQLTDGREAIIRFAGQTTFAPGIWVGVELDDASGKNDGTVQGERYFECPMGHGMFVRPATLKVLPGPPASYLPPVKKKPARPSSTASSKGSTPVEPKLGATPALGRTASVSRVSLACSSLLLPLSAHLFAFLTRPDAFWTRSKQY